MNQDILIDISSAQWTFRPCTFRALQWIERNFSTPELVVAPRRGPNVRRAVVAEGLTVLQLSERSPGSYDQPEAAEGVQAGLLRQSTANFDSV